MDSVRTVMAQAWQQFGGQAASIAPRVLASLLVFVVGVLLGTVVGWIASRVLASSHLDRYAARLGLSSPLRSLGITSVVRAVAAALQCAIVLFASMLALYSLDERLASDLTERLILYVPHLVVALVILAAGAAVAGFVSRSVLIAAVNSEIQAAPLLSTFTRAAVMLVAGAIAFEHLGIGRATVLTAFAILFGGVTLAASIAIGLALKDFVREWVEHRLRHPESTADPINHL